MGPPSPGRCRRPAWSHERGVGRGQTVEAGERRAEAGQLDSEGRSGFLRCRARPAFPGIVDFIREHADHREPGGLRWGVEPSCAVPTEHGLPVAPSTYYEHVRKTPTARQERDLFLLEEIHRVHGGRRQLRPDRAGPALGCRHRDGADRRRHREGLLALAVGAGLQVMAQLMEADVTAVCGPKGRHDPQRSASRHGTERGSVTLGGRRVPVTRPRVRATDGSGELPVPAYELFNGAELFGRMAMERMLGGLRPGTTALAWSRSAGRSRRLRGPPAGLRCRAGSSR